MNADAENGSFQALVDRAVALNLIDGIVRADSWMLVIVEGGEIYIPEAHAPAFLRGLLLANRAHAGAPLPLRARRAVR
jgi:hypothetical protein